MKFKIFAVFVLMAIQNFLLAEENPVVIFLNGTSSAGKSSIAKEIQKLSPNPVIHTGVDDFCLMLPSSYIVHGEHADQGYQFIHAPGPSTTIQVGPVAKRLAQVKHESMKSFLEHGFSLVVDEVLLSEEEFKEYVELFQNYRVLFVAVKPPLEVAEEREKARGDRVLGLARGCYNLTHQGRTYDLTINSAEMTPKESAQAILEFLSTQPDLRTFQSHSQQLNVDIQTNYRFSIDHKAKVEHAQVIQDGVVGFNTPFIGTKSKFCIFLKDEENKTLGGASGNVWPELKLLYLDFVHIAEPLRRLGYGRKLMQEVEAEARRLGCIAILLDTFSFQAEGFYAKLGFTRIGFLENQFGNYDHIYLRKNLE